MSAPLCSFRQWQAHSCQAGPTVALRVGLVLPGPLLHCAVPRAGHTLPFLPPPPYAGASPSTTARSSLATPGIHCPVLNAGALARVAGTPFPPLPCPGLASVLAPVTGPLYGGLTFCFRGAPAGPPACWLQATAPPTRAVRGWQGTPPPLFSPHLFRSGCGARSCCNVCGRARLVRCGDVHPHPGPLRVAFSNVTALRPHCHTVFAWEAHVVLLGETRMTATGHSVMARLAGEAGWHSFFGAPLESPGGGIWDSPPGGTAVLVRQGLPARQVIPPAKEGEHSLATAPWHSTRWCRVLVGLGTGATVLQARRVL